MRTTLALLNFVLVVVTMRWLLPYSTDQLTQLMFPTALSGGALGAHPGIPKRQTTVMHLASRVPYDDANAESQVPLMHSWRVIAQTEFKVHGIPGMQLAR